MANLSTYALSLDYLDLLRYKEKLIVTEHSVDILLPDAYNLSENWFIDPKKLPPTRYPTIYNYLIKTPGRGRINRSPFDGSYPSYPLPWMCNFSLGI